MAHSVARRGAAAVFTVIVAAGTLVVGSGPAAAATQGCRVKNVTRSTWFATQTGQALTRAIERARWGDRLKVFGRCVGHFGIDKDLTLVGNTNLLDPTVLDGAGTVGSVVFVSERATVVLTRLTITGGNTTDSVGGGIQTGGDLTLNRSFVVANRSASDGGGIFNYGELTLNYTELSGNTAGGAGGGLFSEGEAVLNFSLVTRNTAVSGGGILSVNSLTLNSTIVSGNIPDDYCAC